MIGAFVLFGLPSAEVFAAVLTYRVIAFWLPIPPGIVAFFQLRKTVNRWEEEGRERPERVSDAESRRRPPPARNNAPASRATIKSEVRPGRKGLQPGLWVGSERTR